ncbi:presqualene diphosphate synthase HpnD [Kaarinaea lacus]
MTPEEYCQQKAAGSGSSFYYSFLFLPETERKAITALYAFCREVDDIVDECTDEHIARIKLQWWRDTMRKTFQGNPEHPVQRVLTSVVERYSLPLEYFLEIIDGMEMDLDYHRYPTLKELSLYCYRVASVVGLMAAEIFGYQDRGTQKYAHHLGMAFQLTNILRDVHEDAARGRIYIPLDELQRFNVSENDILQNNPSSQLRELLEFQAQRAREYYDKAYSLLSEQDRYSQRTGLIMAAIYQRLLKAIADKNYDVMGGRISLNPLLKLWLAWNTARKEKLRHQKYLQTCRTH